jgi:hypothetical protein
MLVGIITLFFIFLLASDDEMDMSDENLRNNVWTLHPVYSIFKVGTDQFTKGSRYSQLTISVSMMYLAGGVIYSQTAGNKNFSYIGILTISVLCGLVLAYVTTYFTGCFLQRARNVDRRHYVEMQQEFSGAQMKEARDRYERDSFVRYYEYYCISGVIVLTVVIGILFFFLIL